MSVRIYVEDAQKGKEISLTKDQIRHLKVLRLKKEEPVRIFDGKGKEYEVLYSDIVSGRMVLNKQVKPRKETYLRITLATAIPKGPRMDTLIEKVSEIGVSRIVPIITSRSVVKPRSTKIERLRRIIVEACAQSERSVLPELTEPIPLAELLLTVKEYNHAFVCDPEGQPLTKAYCECKSVLIIVGPEGGLTQAEIDAAKEAGCTAISLSPSILRVETAAISAVAQLIGISLGTDKPKAL